MGPVVAHVGGRTGGKYKRIQASFTTESARPNGPAVTKHCRVWDTIDRSIYPGMCRTKGRCGFRGPAPARPIGMASPQA
eukprot:scaffold35173_cov63-Phaeocystis_antarctica.AAC.8